MHQIRSEWFLALFIGVIFGVKRVYFLIYIYYIKRKYHYFPDFPCTFSILVKENIFECNLRLKLEVVIMLNHVDRTS